MFGAAPPLKLRRYGSITIEAFAKIGRLRYDHRTRERRTLHYPARLSARRVAGDIDVAVRFNGGFQEPRDPPSATMPMSGRMVPKSYPEVSMRHSISFLPVIVLSTLLASGCSSKPNATNGSAADPSDNGSVAAHAAAPAQAPAYSVSDSAKGEAAPMTVRFAGPGGAPISLAKFVGKPFLVAIWGSDFPTSVDQLHSLDALAAEGKLAVVALNIDSRPNDDYADSATPILTAQKLTALGDYRDPNKALFSALGGPVTPSSILYDSKGKEVLRILGPANFGTEEVRALLARAN